MRGITHFLPFTFIYMREARARLDIIQSSTTPSLTLTSVLDPRKWTLSDKHLLTFTQFQQCHEKLNIESFVKTDVTAGLLY